VCLALKTNYTCKPDNYNEVEEIKKLQHRENPNSHTVVHNYLPEMRKIGNKIHEEVFNITQNRFMIKRMRLNFMHDKNNNFVFLWADGLRLYGSDEPMANKEVSYSCKNIF
jgi:hypothetical protein